MYKEQLYPNSKNQICVHNEKSRISLIYENNENKLNCLKSFQPIAFKDSKLIFTQGKLPHKILDVNQIRKTKKHILDDSYPQVLIPQNSCTRSRSTIVTK